VSKAYFEVMKRSKLEMKSKRWRRRKYEEVLAVEKNVKR
jgi:hypothetical protein